VSVVSSVGVVGVDGVVCVARMAGLGIGVTEVGTSGVIGVGHGGGDCGGRGRGCGAAAEVVVEEVAADGGGAGGAGGGGAR